MRNENLFWRAIARVEQEFPSLWTPEGLEQLLADCRHQGVDWSRGLVKIQCIKDPFVYFGLAGLEPDSAQSLRRMAADPTGWAIASKSEKVIESAKHAAAMGQILGAEGLSTIMIYHEIRDNIQEVQQSRGISSLCRRKKTVFFGFEVESLDHDWQLFVQPDDLPVLREGAIKVFNLFAEVAPFRVADYEILEDVSDGRDAELVSTTLDTILSLRNRVVLCSIYTSCHDWVPIQGGHYRGVSCDRDPDITPDTIELSIGLDELIAGDGSATSYRSFRLDHKYQGRVP